MALKVLSNVMVPAVFWDGVLYKQGNWGSERQNNLLKVLLLESGWTWTETQVWWLLVLQCLLPRIYKSGMTNTCRDKNEDAFPWDYNLNRLLACTEELWASGVTLHVCVPGKL